MRKRILSIILSVALLTNNLFSSVVFAVDNEASNSLSESKTTVTEQASDAENQNEANEGGIEVDSIAPIISIDDGGVVRVNETTATIKINSSESGSYYYAIAQNKDEIPTIDTTGKGAPIVVGENTITVNNLNSGVQIIYFQVKDSTGNVNGKLKVYVVEEAKEILSQLEGLWISTSSNPTISNSWLWTGKSAPTNGNSHFVSDTYEYKLMDQSSESLNRSLYFRAKPVEEGATVKLYYTNGEGEKEVNLTTTGDKSDGIVVDITGITLFKVVVTPPSTSPNKPCTYIMKVYAQPNISKLDLKQSGVNLALTPKFSNKVFQYDITIPETYKSIDVLAEAAINKNSITYNGETSSIVNIENKDKIEVAVTGGYGEGKETTIYTVNLNKVPEAGVKFEVNPSDATVLLYETNTKTKIGANKKGIFDKLTTGVDYTYVVSKSGYVTQKGSFVAGEQDTNTVKVDLVKAPANNIEIVSSQWKNFRNSDVNMAITDIALPTKPEETVLNWATNTGTGFDTPSLSLIVDNHIITMTANSQRLLKVSLETGEIVKEVKMAAKCNWGYTPPSYAEGMIFVPLTNGTIQAFNAKTLESLWVYNDPLKGQSLSPITYSDGYIYTGFWNSETGDANYVCLSVTDEDVTKSDEKKEATWYQTTPGGFYWAGSVVIGDAVIFGTDDGVSGFNSQSHLYSLNKYTGEVISDIEIIGDQRSTIAYDAESGRIFFTTKCGYLYSAAVDPSTGVVSDLKGINHNAQTTSTPVVYKGRVYIGFGSGISTTGSTGALLVADANTLEKIYDVPMLGYPQCSMLLSTAEEKETGYIYLYATYNTKPGGITMIKTTNTATAEDKIEAVELYDARGYEEYCISSIICDVNGNMYYRNDKPYLYSIGKNEAYLTQLSVEGGNVVIPEFSGNVMEYEAIVDRGTESIEISAASLDGMAISINGEAYSGGKKSIKLKEGKATTEVEVKKDNYTRRYTVSIREKNNEASLGEFKANSSNTYGSSLLTLTPEFTSDVYEYIADGASLTKTFFNIWPDAKDKNATIKVYPVWGCRDNEEIKVTSSNAGHKRYAIYFGNNNAKAQVKIEVIAEDGVTKNDYIVTLTRQDIYSPEIAYVENSIVRDGKDIEFKLNLSEDASLYYEVVESGEAEPNVSTATQGISASRGENTIKLKNITEEAKDIYFVAKDEASNISTILKVQIGQYTPPTIKTITINPEENTFGEVSISVIADDADGLADNAYSFDGGTTWQVENKVVIAKNQTMKAGTIKVKDKSGNVATYDKDIVINNIKLNIADSVIADVSDVTFNGNEIKPILAVTFNGEALEFGKDYEVSYSNNINAGTATITVHGKGIYDGTTTKTFNIKPVDISSAVIGKVESVEFTGEEINPKFDVALNGEALVLGQDYEVNCSNNINVGTATISVVGKGNYKGTVSSTFKITGKDIADATVEDIADVEYTGDEIKPSVIVVSQGETLELGKDYEVNYSNNTKVGTAKVIIEGKGNYKGTITSTFQITEKKIEEINKSDLNAIINEAVKAKYNITYKAYGEKILVVISSKEGVVIREFLVASTVDEVKEAINAAEENNKPQDPTEPNKPEKPSKPENPSKPNEIEKPTKPGLPQTGGDMSSMAMALASLGLLSTGIVMTKKKKDQ